MDDQNSQQVPSANSPAQTPPVQPAPSTTPPAKAILSGKLIILIAILLIIFAGGGAYFFLSSQNKPLPIASQTSPTSASTPTIDSTASWKTYIGHGFEFNYPIGYEQEEVGNFVTLKKDPEKDTEAGRLFITSSKGVIFTFVKLDDNMNLSVDELKKEFTYDTVEDISMGENKIYKIIPSSNSGIEPHDFFISKGTQTARAGIGIGIKVDEETKKESLKQFNQILSTFKFTQ